MTTSTNDKIQWTKIKHDVNGNPRYVCSYLSLLTKRESSLLPFDEMGRTIRPTKYEIACQRANKIGGRKYHTKAYGGGIVFQSYNLQDAERSIFELVEKESKGE